MGVAKDEAQAVRWYRTAAEVGFAESRQICAWKKSGSLNIRQLCG
jgi:TPR repeat protein